MTITRDKTNNHKVEMTIKLIKTSLGVKKIIIIITIIIIIVLFVNIFDETGEVHQKSLEIKISITGSQLQKLKKQIKPKSKPLPF